MIRICPRCQGLSQHTFLCPRCGIQTQEAEPAGGNDSVGAIVLPDPPTFAGGIVLGLLVAQGATYALHHLTSAILLAGGGPGYETVYWNSTAGIITVQALRGMAIFAAAIFAGAGQPRAWLVGAALGAVNAALLILFRVAVRQPIDPLIFSILPAGHAVLGVLGGSIGGWIWQPSPPPPALSTATGPGQESLTTLLPEHLEPEDVEPFPWSRLAVGALIAVVGTLCAGWIRIGVVMVGGGAAHEMQSSFITWQITVVAQLIGGIVAGANSRHGAIVGFWAGLLSAAFIVFATSLGRVPASEISSWLLGGASAESQPAAMMVQGIQALMLGFIGGWLGALIMPARVPVRSIDGAR